MNISLRLLRYAIAAADTGNVTKAAKAIGVSQPSISAAIAELEQMLGIEIFVRHHAKGVSLTLAGREIIEGARDLVARADAFEKRAVSAGSAIKGAVSLGYLPGAYSPTLSNAVDGFMQAHQGTSVSVETLWHDGLIEGFQKGDFDAIITIDAGIPDSLAVDKIAETYFLGDGMRVTVPVVIAHSGAAARPVVRNFVQSIIGAMQAEKTREAA